MGPLATDILDEPWDRYGELKDGLAQCEICGDINWEEYMYQNENGEWYCERHKPEGPESE